MSGQLILDTGPWVALLCRDDAHHEWAKTQFAQHAAPFLTCEAVVAETCFLLSRAGFDPSRALALVERGVVRIAMSLAEQVAAVRALFERYDNVPASLADACLVRMSELYEPSRVLTLDSDFMIYRRHGRKVIPVLSP
jgi:predicted nucleic acid-binding protein